jgi:hypothetical protein
MTIHPDTTFKLALALAVLVAGLLGLAAAWLACRARLWNERIRNIYSRRNEC